MNKSRIMSIIIDIGIIQIIDNIIKKGVIKILIINSFFLYYY